MQPGILDDKLCDEYRAASLWYFSRIRVSSSRRVIVSVSLRRPRRHFIDRHEGLSSGSWHYVMPRITKKGQTKAPNKCCCMARLFVGNSRLICFRMLGLHDRLDWTTRATTQAPTWTRPSSIIIFLSLYSLLSDHNAVALPHFIHHLYISLFYSLLFTPQ